MRKLKVVLCLAVLSAAALSGISIAYAEGRQLAETAVLAAPEVQSQTRPIHPSES